MSGTSAYVHSKKDNADLSVGVNIIDNIKGIDNFADTTYTQSTISKLNSIAANLDSAADNFLQGYSLDAAEAIADNANEALVQLANRILYGTSAYEMTNTLMRNQNIKTKDLIPQLQNSGGKIAQEIIEYLEKNKDSTIGELATFITNTLSQGRTTIEVSEAGSHIVELGKLFDVNTINTTFRKTTEAVITENIFKTSKELVTRRGGAYRNMIKDLIRSSKYGTVQSKGSAINSFCNKLGKKMHDMALKEIPFEWSGDPNILDKQIDGFTRELKEQLKQKLDSKKMLDISNVRGAIGEEVRESVTKAGNSVIIGLQVGDLSEEQLTDEMEKILKEIGVESNLSQMNSFHASNKMSQTDLILVNTKTKAIARAQSKNHFISRFTSNKQDTSQIDNFRWKVEDSVNLLNFINNLSSANTGFGVSLGDFDINNITGAIANNLWQQKIGSYYSEGGTIVGGTKSGIDFKKELEGSLEKMMAGQIVNLLGITLQRSYEGLSIDAGASNIFYILNGRLKRTADLVREAIQQIEENNVKNLTTDRSRLVNVTLTGMNLSGVETEGFLVDKLQHGSYIGNKFRASQSIGEAMGEKIIDNIQVTVSLGTSIDVIKKTSLVF